MLGGGFLKILRILGTSAAVIFGGTFAISAVTSAVVRYTDLKRRAEYGMPCRACKGRGFYPCKLCKSSGTIEWSPLYDPVHINPCLCPTCDGQKVQRCLNCLGYGSV